MPQREPSGFPAGLAVLTSLFAVGLGVVAIGVAATSDGGGGAAATAPPGAAVGVELADFSISPDPIEVDRRGHPAPSATPATPSTTSRCAIRTSATEDLQPGSSQDLALSGLAEGSYSVLLHHRRPRRRRHGGHPPGRRRGRRDRDRRHHRPHHGARRRGHRGGLGPARPGDARLDPRVPRRDRGRGQPAARADRGHRGRHQGVRPRRSAITDWEVEPGKSSRPAATTARSRARGSRSTSATRCRSGSTNDLPMGTDVHCTASTSPTRWTASPRSPRTSIEPNGGTFTYEFTAERQSLGMYHAHHHGQMQVPNGLFGMFQIDDMPLPRGQTDQRRRRSPRTSRSPRRSRWC